MPDPIRYEILPLDQVLVYKSNTIQQDCIDKFGEEFAPIMFLWIQNNDPSGFDNNRELIRSIFKGNLDSKETRFFYRLEKILRLYTVWLHDQQWRDPLPTVPFGVGRYHSGVDRMSVMKSLNVTEYNCLIIEKNYITEENLPEIRSYWKGHADNLHIVDDRVLANRDNFDTILEFRKTNQWLKSGLPITTFCSPNIRNKMISNLRSKGKAPKSPST